MDGEEIQERLRNYFSYLLAVLLTVMIVGMAIWTGYMMLTGV